MTRQRPQGSGARPEGRGCSGEQTRERETAHGPWVCEARGGRARSQEGRESRGPEPGGTRVPSGCLCPAPWAATPPLVWSALRSPGTGWHRGGSAGAPSVWGGLLCGAAGEGPCGFQAISNPELVCLGGGWLLKPVSAVYQRRGRGVAWVAVEDPWRRKEGSSGTEGRGRLFLPGL